MTAAGPPMTDDLLRRALQELAVGPDGSTLTDEVMRAVAVIPQKRNLFISRLFGGRTTLLVAAALLVALIAAVAVTGGLPRPVPTPFIPPTIGPQTIVVELWNGLRGDAYALSHTAFAPGSEVGIDVLSALPDNAGAPRWAPDGSAMTYFTYGAPEDRSVEPTSLYLANADGTDPKPVDLPRPIGLYVTNGWWSGVVSGVVWAPNGIGFALWWNAGTCSGAPACLPPTGIDVFAADGTLVGGVEIENGHHGPVWSPDGSAIGWTTGPCPNGDCRTDAFHWQPIGGNGAEVTIPLEPSTSVSWSTNNRLLAVTLDPGFPTVTRVYSMTPTGADERDVPWDPPADTLLPAWSPDGNWLVATDFDAAFFRDVPGGIDSRVAFPTGLYFTAWSPDSHQVLLWGGSTNPQAYDLWVVGPDGSGLVQLGDGNDVGWMPISSTATSTSAD